MASSRGSAFTGHIGLILTVNCRESDSRPREISHGLHGHRYATYASPDWDSHATSRQTHRMRPRAMNGRFPARPTREERWKASTAPPLVRKASSAANSDHSSTADTVSASARGPGSAAPRHRSHPHAFRIRKCPPREFRGNSLECSDATRRGASTRDSVFGPSTSTACRTVPCTANLLARIHAPSQENRLITASSPRLQTTACHRGRQRPKDDLIAMQIENIL